MKTDEELIATYQRSRDEASFAELVKRHAAMVHRTCLRLLGDHHEAEDACQATFMVLARKAGSFRSGTRLGDWLHGIARRVSLEALRTRTRRQAREQRSSGSRREGSASGPDKTANAYLAEVVDKELRALPARQRSAVILRYLEDRSLAESAGVLGCPKGTLGWLANDGLERLKRRLAARGHYLTVTALAGLLQQEAQAAASTGVVASMTKACHGIVGGSSAAASGSRIALLAEGTMKAMTFAKLKAAALVMAAGTMVSAAVPVATPLLSDGDVAEAQAAPATPETVGRKVEKPAPKVFEPKAPKGAHKDVGQAPVVDGEEGKRAFNDLAAYYKNNKKVPPYKKALRNLKAADQATRMRAGRYLFALFSQMFADESNGRSPTRRSPFWGSRPTKDAREFRKVVAKTFGEQATGDGALEATRWLINEEKFASNQAHGIKALRRIRGPGADETYKKLLDQPHPNEKVVIGILEEAGARNIKALAPNVKKLAAHYRTRVREAARAAALKMKLGAQPAYQHEKAYSPWMNEALKSIRAMVTTKIPANAKWARFAIESKGARTNNVFLGWLLKEDAGAYHVLDMFGGERRLKKVGTRMVPEAFAASATWLVKTRKDPKEGRALLSRRGGLTAQFEPRFLSLPEALVAAWSHEKGDTKSAAEILFPRMDGMADDRWLLWATGDYLGHFYYQQMLRAFSHERDYRKALELARHITTKPFAEHTNQKRCVKLVEQLTLRLEDFKTFKLPNPNEWVKLQKALKRPEQIAYLGKRIRLLNCIQLGQPGGVSYASRQIAEPSSKLKGRGTECINPYNELKAMNLTVDDLSTLVPFLADENYMPTFSYWRDFHTKRTLHQVNWVVAQVIDDAVQGKLSDLKTYFSLSEMGKKEHIKKILAWCKKNAGKAPPFKDLKPLRKANPRGPRIDAP